MRVALLTYGSRGDVQPFIALALGLQTRGHEVVLAGPPNSASLVEQQGVPFRAVGVDIAAMLNERVNREVIQGGNILEFVRFRFRENPKLLGKLNLDALEACRGSGAILYKVGIPIGYSVAEHLGVPCMEVAFQPFAPTREFASPAISTWGGGPVRNRLTHLLANSVVWQMYRTSVNGFRREVLGLPSLPVLTPGPQWSVPCLYAYSRHVVPPPADWPARIHVTGYWFLRGAEGWQPPAELQAFLDAGEPPVYVGFGSMTQEDPDEAVRIVVEALERAGRRGIISGGWAGLGEDAELPESVYALRSAPHDWLFPRMAAVVHHGGAGTTAAGLLAGAPTVIVPHIVDQPFWGARVQELGVGPEPILRRKLTAENLAEAIRQATWSREMRERAEELALRIRAEDGVAGACELVEGLVG